MFRTHLKKKIGTNTVVATFCNTNKRNKCDNYIIPLFSGFLCIISYHSTVFWFPLYQIISFPCFLVSSVSYEIIPLFPGFLCIISYHSTFFWFPLYHIISFHCFLVSSVSYHIISLFSGFLCIISYRVYVL